MINSRIARAGLTATLGLFTLCIWMVFPSAVIAQDGPCDQVIELAERYYEQNRTDEVVAIVSDCINDEAPPVATAVRGYRLLALTYLRADQLADAKLAIIELLGRDPSYETDPVQDLPAYSAMVNNIKVQLALQTRTGPQNPIDSTSVVPPPTDPIEPAQSGIDYRPQDRIMLDDGRSDGSQIELRFRSGWSSYGGERGDSGAGFFDEFADNGGLALTAELAFLVSDAFAVGFHYQLGQYDNMHKEKGTPPEFPTIALGQSSPWLHYLGVVARGYVQTSGIVRPYGQFAYVASFGLINDKVSVGSGPKFAAGIDIAIDESFGLYMEIEEQLILPGTAADLVDRDFGYDLFSGAGVGLRYVIGK